LYFLHLHYRCVEASVADARPNIEDYQHAIDDMVMTSPLERLVNIYVGRGRSESGSHPHAVGLTNQRLLLCSLFFHRDRLERKRVESLLFLHVSSVTITERYTHDRSGA
jgi:hypothetical protein